MRARASTRAQDSVREEIDRETLTETPVTAAKEVPLAMEEEVTQKPRAERELELRAANIPSSTLLGRWADVASRALSTAETLRRKAEGWMATDL